MGVGIEAAEVGAARERRQQRGPVPAGPCAGGMSSRRIRASSLVCVVKPWTKRSWSSFSPSNSGDVSSWQARRIGIAILPPQARKIGNRLRTASAGSPNPHASPRLKETPRWVTRPVPPRVAQLRPRRAAVHEWRPPLADRATMAASVAVKSSTNGVVRFLMATRHEQEIDYGIQSKAIPAIRDQAETDSPRCSREAHPRSEIAQRHRQKVAAATRSGPSPRATTHIRHEADAGDADESEVPRRPVPAHGDVVHRDHRRQPEPDHRMGVPADKHCRARRSQLVGLAFPMVARATRRKQWHRARRGAGRYHRRRKESARGWSTRRRNQVPPRGMHAVG